MPATRRYMLLAVSLGSLYIRVSVLEVLFKAAYHFLKLTASSDQGFSATSELPSCRIGYSSASVSNGLADKPRRLPRASLRVGSTCTRCSARLVGPLVVRDSSKFLSDTEGKSFKVRISFASGKICAWS